MPKPFPTNIKSGPGQGASGKPGPQGPEGPGFAPSIDLTGNRAQQAVIGLRERPISADPPAVGNVYAWNGVQWAPVTISSGGNVPDPDTGNVFDVLTVFGNYSPVATILTSSGEFWSVNYGDVGNPSILRTDLSTNRPDLIIIGPSSSEEWYNIIEIPGNVLVVVGDNSSGIRFMRAIDLSVSPPVIGEPCEVGLRPVTSDYGGGKSPGSIAFDGTYLWTVVSTGGAYAQYTGGGTAAISYYGSIILSDGSGEFPTYAAWVTFDPNGSNYSDGLPRLWFLSGALSSSTDYYAVMDRVVIGTYTIDLSVPINNELYRPCEILIGGNRLFYLQSSDNDGNVARINPDTGDIETWVFVNPTGFAPASFAYDPETSNLIVSTIRNDYSGLYVNVNIITANLNSITVVDLPLFTYPGIIGVYPAPSNPPIAHLSVWDTTGGHGWIPSGGWSDMIYKPTPNLRALVQVDISTHDVIYSNHHMLAYAAAGSGGGATDFTNVVFVDSGTTGAQTGTSEDPFITITQAIAALTSGGTIIIVPGYYGSEPAITFTQLISFINLAGLIYGAESFITNGAEVYLPPLYGPVATIQGCSIAEIISVDSVTMNNCYGGNITCAGSLIVTNSTINGVITLSNGYAIFTGCRSFGPTINMDSNYQLEFYNCNVAYQGAQPTIIFNAPGGIVYVDSTTWYHFKLQSPAYGPSLTNAVIKLMGGIGSDGSDSSPSNTNLSTNSSTAVFVVNDFGKWFAPSSDYTIVLGARILFWQPSTKTNTGFLDMTVCMHITTNASGVATVELKSAINSNSIYLPTILSTAVGTITATAGGFTIYATRPTGVAFTARAKWWFASAELLA